MCYVAYDPKAEEELYKTSQKKSEYELPDGKVITLGSQKFRCPEALFNPMMMGK